MPISDDIRKTLTDPTPLYFAAGVLDKIREEAPERIAAVRSADPKEVQAKVTAQAREAQAKVTEVLGGFDPDVRKLREQAAGLALQGVGVAAEYVIKARESYDELAERGRGAVKSWRGEEEAEEQEVTVERAPAKIAEPPVRPAAKKTTARKPGGSGSAAESAANPERSVRSARSAPAESATAPAAAAPESAKTQAKPNAKPKPDAKAKPAAKKTATRRTTAPDKSAPESDS